MVPFLGSDVTKINIKEYKTGTTGRLTTIEQQYNNPNKTVTLAAFLGKNWINHISNV